MDYLLNSSMEMLDEYYQPKDTDVVISLVSTEECEQRYHSLPYYHILARNMQNHNIRYCKAEMFKDCILGTLLIPDKRSIEDTVLSISFYMNKNLLVLVDDSKHIQAILTILEEGELLNCKTIAEFLCQLIGTLTLEDALFLQELEQHMSDLEEKIIKHTISDSSAQLMHIRKRLLILHSYYQQISVRIWKRIPITFFRQKNVRFFLCMHLGSNGSMIIPRCFGNMPCRFVKWSSLRLTPDRTAPCGFSP